MKIHSYFNSSTSFRVRIALALKDLPFESIPVNLRQQAQQSDSHKALNPSAGVPVLTDGDVVLTQSLAIIDYLDALHPQPRLIPQEPLARARVLELALGIACDIHPVNNLRVLQYLQRELGIGDAQKQAWYQHWVAQGLGATEALLHRAGVEADVSGSGFCWGDQPTLADCCLIPQVFNAQRMGCPLDAYPRVMAIYQHCMGLPVFQVAAPANQPDYAG